jgi:hypothetical protein
MSLLQVAQAKQMRKMVLSHGTGLFSSSDSEVIAQMLARPHQQTQASSGAAGALLAGAVIVHCVQADALMLAEEITEPSVHAAAMPAILIDSKGAVTTLPAARSPPGSPPRRLMSASAAAAAAAAAASTMLPPAALAYRSMTAAANGVGGSLGGSPAASDTSLVVAAGSSDSTDSSPSSVATGPAAGTARPPVWPGWVARIAAFMKVGAPENMSRPATFPRRVLCAAGLPRRVFLRCSDP